MAECSAAFVWYELLTTDLAAAQSFYGKLIGWQAQEAATPQFDYRIFSTSGTPVSGLMELPPEGRKKGAAPRWIGYVAVTDLDGTVGRLKTLGGTVYVPPTNSNIGRIAVIADPQTATLALVEGLIYGGQQTTEPGVPGRVGWHELFAADVREAFDFYSALLDWRAGEAEVGAMESYQLFTAGGRTLGGMFTKFASTPVPFWLYYFEVADLDVATERVRAEGGRITRGPIELWGGTWIAHCIDPQGAMFALQGKRASPGTAQAGNRQSAPQLGWSARWGGFSSQGRLVLPKPKG